MAVIPPQLRMPANRFVKINRGEKRPFENEWTTKANYAYNDPALLEHLAKGGNYGVVCGYGGVVVLDIDSQKFLLELDGKLPETLRIKTGGDGIHDYFITPDEDIKKVVLEKDGEHVGEFQAIGTQVVGAGSVHPNGKTYEVIRDVPIATLTKEQAMVVLGAYSKKAQTKREQAPSVYSTLELNITQVVNTNGLRKRGGEYQGEHPLHGSDTGQNFCVNPSKNVWHCFRCNSGGGPLEWIAVSEGLLQCSDIRPGCLGKELFKKVLKVAQEKYGYVPPSVKYAESARPGELTYEHISALIDIRQADQARFVTAQELMTKLFFRTHPETKEVYRYKNGYYCADGGVFIEGYASRLWGRKGSAFQVNEILGHVRRLTYTDVDKWDSPPNWLCLKNGILDTDTLEFSPHTPAFLTLNQLEVEYDPNADCPAFKKFLGEVLYPQDIQIIQEMIGYCLEKDYPAHKAFMLVGDGANGKSTLLNVIRTLLGKNNVSSVSLQDINSKQFSIAALVGKLANIYPDMPSYALSDTGKFKALTGNDSIGLDQKYKNFTMFKNYAKFIFSCNTVPENSDDSPAFWRRWSILTFPNSFALKPDRDLTSKLTTPEELSGVLNFAIAGLKRLREGNWEFADSRSQEEVRQLYRRLSSPIAAFADDCLERKMDYVITKEDMYATFVRYCHDHKMNVADKSMLGRKLPSVAEGITETKVGERGDRKTAWKGYAIKKEGAESEAVLPDGTTDGGLQIEDVIPDEVG